MVNIEESLEWQRIAAMDLSTAEYLLGMSPLPIEIICYHCQQSAEKYLKGYLVFCGMAPPRMHDLDELCKLCVKLSDIFNNIADQCSDLTAYGVQPRYPMELILEEEDMQQALASARAIRNIILTDVMEKIDQKQKQDESELE
jgi:HEPN domain-containing protein